MKIRPVGSE